MALVIGPTGGHCGTHGSGMEEVTELPRLDASHGRLLAIALSKLAFSIKDSNSCSARPRARLIVVGIHSTMVLSSQVQDQFGRERLGRPIVARPLKHVAFRCGLLNESLTSTTKPAMSEKGVDIAPRVNTIPQGPLVVLAQRKPNLPRRTEEFYNGPGWPRVSGRFCIVP